MQRNIFDKKKRKLVFIFLKMHTFMEKKRLNKGNFVSGYKIFL